MADTLLIHFNPDKPDTATWSLVNNAGELTTMLSQGAISDAASVAEKHKTVVLLDNTSVHVDSTKLPITNRKKLLRAIPFALEEHIADDVDELHFVAGKTQSDGSVPVAAIKKDTLEAISRTLDQAGICPDAIIPDSLCITANSRRWAILIQDNQANIQFNTFSGGEFDLDTLPVIFPSLLQQETITPPEDIILFTRDGDSNEIISQAIIDAIPGDVELINVSYNTHPLVVYCGHYHNAMPLNLLQGAYKPKSKNNIAWHQWRLAAALAVAWLVLQLGSASVEYYELEEKNGQLKAQINKLYKKAFPESKKIVNARVQMEQKLNELKGSGSTNKGSSIIALLSDSADALSSESGVTLQAINYRNNKMDLQLTGTTLQDIESLNKKINQRPLKSEITSSSSENNQVKGNIIIQKAGS